MTKKKKKKTKKKTKKTKKKMKKKKPTLRFEPTPINFTTIDYYCVIEAGYHLARLFLFTDSQRAAASKSYTPTSPYDCV